MTTPYHKSERMFRTYEPAIKQIVNNWPRVTLFEPKGSIETFSCRLRDSIQSWRENKWASQELFGESLPEIVVSTSFQPGKVAAGPRDELKRKKTDVVAAGFVVDARPSTGLVFETNDQKAVEAVLYLHHCRLLVEPSTVKTTLLIQNHIGAFDVFVEQIAENTYSVT